MKLKLIAGDHEWSLEGTHVCDERGIAKILEDSEDLIVSDDVAARILPIIEGARVVRGLLPDGSKPKQEEQAPIDNSQILELTESNLIELKQIEPVIPESILSNDSTQLKQRSLQTAKTKRKKEV